MRRAAAAVVAATSIGTAILRRRRARRRRRAVGFGLGGEEAFDIVGETNLLTRRRRLGGRLRVFAMGRYLTHYNRAEVRATSLVGRWHAVDNIAHERRQAPFTMRVLVVDVVALLHYWLRSLQAICDVNSETQFAFKTAYKI